MTRKNKNRPGQQQGQAQTQAQGKGPAKGQAKGRPQRDLEEENEEENDFDILHGDRDDDEDNMGEIEDFGDDDELFWNLIVNPEEDVMLEQPPNPAALIHITHACFGEQVNKGSRTILYCSTPSLEEPVPICILTEGSHESHPLNLKFGSPASFSIKGRQPSIVYLSGYLQADLPPMMDDMDDMEDMDENEIDLEDEDEPQFRPQSRKRGAPEEDIHGQEPTTKKRKIEVASKKAVEDKKTPETKPKNTNANKGGQSQSQTQSQTQTPAKTDTTQTSTPETKTLSKKQAKKQKKLQQGNNDDKSKTEAATPSADVTEKTNETSEKNENKEQTTTKDESKTETAKPQKQNTNEPKKLPSGIEIKDIKVGTGAVVQNGQTLYLHYVGQLEDKTVFEKQLTGAGYEFKLGSQDAPVQGWNLGIKGMKIGGKRRITIPSKFAYGEKGNEEKKIPANASLTFTIEVKDAK